MLLAAQILQLQVDQDLAPVHILSPIIISLEDGQLALQLGDLLAELHYLI